MKNKNTTNYNVTDLVRLFEEVSDLGRGYSSTGTYRALGALMGIVEGHMKYGHDKYTAEAYDLQNQINRTCEDLKKELAQQETALLKLS